jgi:hypothetical protein
MKNLLPFFLLFCLPCFGYGNYKNTISLALGDPEILDFEYQYAFDPFYIAIKPGIIVMLIYRTNINGWNAYPAIRWGADMLKFGSFKIGPQFECAYFYSSWAEKSVLVSGGADERYFASNDYSEGKNDYFIFSFGPAIRYFVNRLEFQLCAGFHTETTITYSKTITNNSKMEQTTIRDTKFLPMARISAGFLF